MPYVGFVTSPSFYSIIKFTSSVRTSFKHEGLDWKLGNRNKTLSSLSAIFKKARKFPKVDQNGRESILQSSPTKKIKLTLKRLRRMGVKPLKCIPDFFVISNIIITYMFPGNFTEIHLVVQKIWRLSSSILRFFDIYFLQKRNDVSIKQIMPTIAWLSLTLLV